MFFLHDFSTPVERWESVVPPLEPGRDLTVVLCDFQDQVKKHPAVWGCSLMKLSRHAMGKPRPHGEATCGCPSQQATSTETQMCSKEGFEITPAPAII